MTFGSQEAINDEAQRVNGMHARVVGRFGDDNRAYRASDPDLLLWVHAAFTDSFLVTYQLYSPNSVDADEYVAKWASAVVPLGLTDPPRTSAHPRCTRARAA